MANEYRYFLESNSVGVNRLFVLVYSEMTMQKGIKPKGIIKSCYIIINGKNVYNQSFDS